MKPILLISLLVLSLAANAYFAVREYRATDTQGEPFSTSTILSSGSSPSRTVSSERLSPTIWQRLAQGDPAALTLLRSAGWPDETLRLLATALINERFRPEIAANDYFDYYTLNRSSRVSEKDALLKTLFGNLLSPETRQNPALQGIPPEKVATILAIKTDYESLRHNLTNASEGGDNSFEKQLAILAREERTDIRRLLTHDEFFEYELRNSVTASELRYNTAAFEPAEAEFRALFRIKNPLDEPAFDLDDSAARKLRKHTEAALDAQARPILGEERFQQFVLSRDAEYRRFYHLTKHLQLPTQTARVAYELKADIDRRSRTLDADPATTAEARLALAQDAESRLATTFGPAGIEIYKLNSRYLDLLRLPPAERRRVR